MSQSAKTGPLTLMCQRCKRRNVGREKPIVPTGRTRKATKGRKRYEVRCACGWTFWTVHRTMQEDMRCIVRDAPLGD